MSKTVKMCYGLIGATAVVCLLGSIICTIQMIKTVNTLQGHGYTENEAYN